MAVSVYNLVGFALILLVLFMQWQVYVSRIILTFAFSSVVVAFAFVWQGLSEGRPVLVVPALLTAVIRAALIPVLIVRSLHKTPWRAREDRPVVGTASSILLALGFILLALWLYSWAIDGSSGAQRYGALPFALLFQGAFLIISRRNAYIQLAGYLVIENAILLLAAWTFPELPLLVEGAVLLDLIGIVAVSRIIMRMREASVDESSKTARTDVRERLRG